MSTGVPDEEALGQLIAMGFEEIMARQALIGAHNDLNMAISLLTDQQDGGDTVELDKITHYGSTSDSPPAPLTTDDTVDVFHDTDNGNPPSYEQVVLGETEAQTDDAKAAVDEGSDAGHNDEMTSGALQEFPLTNLYELEGRVFTESWSIPFRRNESLGKCLLSSIAHAKVGED